MESSQKSIRVMHYIGEFLDLDATSFTNIAEFIALIQAIREGLSRIDSGFAVSDFHINLLFLSKLEAHPDWSNWARIMLRNQRIAVSDYSAQCMPFYELAEVAIQHEREMRAQAAAAKKKEQDGIIGVQWQDDGNNNHLRFFTQEEINSFVIRQMRMEQEQQQTSTTTHKPKGHSKRPSQEEINEFVVRQMREEQERNTRARSRSEPEPNIPTAKGDATTTTTMDNATCDRCGGKGHLGRMCRFYSIKPTAVVPRANFAGKKVEFCTVTPGGVPVYHTSFALT